MCGSTLSRGLLAHAIFAVNHRRFFGVDRQLEGEMFGHGLQLLRFEIRPIPLRAPVAVPYSGLRDVGPGEPGTRTVQALSVKETVAVDIAEREVRHPEILHVPDG